jgi:CDP-glycerol glycerophosphotransferase (TagB/SpsB family)
VNVVVKLHDRSQHRFRAKLGQDHEGAIRARRSTSRIRLFAGHDVIPLLRHASVLVSDLSSVTNEFLLCDRPIVYAATARHEKKIRKSGARRFGSDDPHDLDWLRAAGEVAANPLEIRQAVVRGLEDPRYRSDLRRERSRVIFYNPGAATAVAVRVTRQLLGIPSARTE